MSKCDYPECSFITMFKAKLAEARALLNKILTEMDNCGEGLCISGELFDEADKYLKGEPTAGKEQE